MGTEQLEYAYAGTINKWEPHPSGDGTIFVYGVATDPSQDLDGQGCDPEWLKTAMPEWFKFANIREQHGKTAAGVGKELEHADGDKWMLKSHIVDSETIKKVKHRVLTGYSVGIRDGKVLRGKAAGFPNGKIVGGKIVEVSLVDRPCNPNATITICKAAPGSDELEAVEPLLIDIDPAMYGEPADGVASGDDDADGQSDDETDSQAVDGAVDGDGDPDDGVSLFDELDEDERGYEPTDDVDKALELADDDGAVTITKGLLESLIHGTKKPKAKRDADGDGKVGEGEERAKEKARLDAERARKRKHNQAMDAEAMRDANHAQQQGRREEAGEHRGRLGSYRKALELREYRAGVKLVGLVLDGVITKSMEDSWRADDGEVIAELAELIIAEASQLADGGFEGPEDVSLLVDACAAIAKMAGAGPTILKSAGTVVDESTAAATLDVAEIVKAQVAEFSQVIEAQKGEIANLTAQVTKMAATPLPGGPVIGRIAMPSTPAQTSHMTKALDLERRAADLTLAPEVRLGYLEMASAERAKG